MRLWLRAALCSWRLSLSPPSCSVGQGTLVGNMWLLLHFGPVPSCQSGSLLPSPSLRLPRLLIY
ncbi:hypothetical protein M758_7G180100 [Ceratodon purpureus]|nr:hypothetical protein M758_7G180100 [Ceratodon purpureus]